MQVIVVEDNKQFGRFMETALEKAGHIVTVYGQADSLLDPDRWAGVEATVVDLILRGSRYDGLELLLWLEHHGLGGRRVIVTGWPTLAAFNDVLETLAEWVLHKPFDVEELQQAVKSDKA